jgi:hypothetical protein
MKTRAVEKRFFFHANAVALAGHVRRPDDSFIPAMASACLPVTGGVGEAVSKRASFGDLLSYRSASSRVSGDFEDSSKAAEFTHGNHGKNGLPTATSAESRVTGLRMTNGGRVLEIESLEAKMEAFSNRRGSTEFHSLSAEFQGVRVDGIGLKIATHCEVFTEYTTRQKLLQAFAKNQKFRDSYASFFFTEKPLNPRQRSLPQTQGIIYGTIVSNLEWEGPAPKSALIAGNSVKIQGFGSIYFGEILIEESSRRLTLVRFQLGSPSGGDGSLAEVQTNGSSWPPRS